MTNPKTETYGYIRCISRSEISMERQKLRVAAFAARAGWSVPIIFTDIDVKANEEGSGFNALIKHCKAAPGSKVIVAEPSRFARFGVEYYRCLEACARVGATVYSTDGKPFDESKMIAELMLSSEIAEFRKRKRWK
ncbi:DNA invertase Pin-like site-specific DNA recombinase [Devosia sp. UYZn731]|uniref:recombinase family protein n=1 Tax=Devosia sp. UYZn731 TaxID=3156345 RepID=UPI0033979154